MPNNDFGTAMVIEQALHAALRAPSPYNTQPWHFSVSDAEVTIALDHDRVLEVIDPDGRQARLACGAALFNLRLALRAAGRVALVDVLGSPEALATVTVRGERAATPAERHLMAAVDRRSTNRRVLFGEPPSSAARDALATAATIEGARLVALDPPTGVLELVRAAERAHAENADYQRELREWTTAGDRDDGVPATSGGPRAPIDTLLSGSTMDGPMLAVLATTGDEPADQVRAGQALQRVLLAATILGLSVSFLSAPTENPQTRQALQRLIGGWAHPQTVLLIGYGHLAPHTPRRPLRTVADLSAMDGARSVPVPGL